jgi:hypothetical protein
MTGVAAEAVGERVAGRRPSRIRAAMTAVVVGAGAAYLTYRLLRAEG